MQTRTKPLVTSEDIAEMMAGGHKVVPIDVRDAGDYEAGHIPGAVNIPDVFYYLASTTRRGQKEMQEHFAKLFGEAGLTGAETAVIYEEGFSLKSPRGYWILEYLGYPKMAVLQGGMREWRKGGYPVTIEPTEPAGSASDFPLSVDESVMCTKGGMLDTLDDPDTIKLDVRDKEEWMAESSSPYGVNFSPRMGRIPGSTWMDWNLLLTLGKETEGSFNVTADKGDFKDLTEVEKMLEDKGVTKDRDIVLYCFKGARTSNTYCSVTKGLGHMMTPPPSLGRDA